MKSQMLSMQMIQSQQLVKHESNQKSLTKHSFQQMAEQNFKSSSINISLAKSLSKQREEFTSKQESN